MNIGLDRTFQSNVHWPFVFLFKKKNYILGCIRSLWHTGFSSCGEEAQLLCGMWDLLPDQGLNPYPLHWKADSTTGPLGMAWPFVFSFLH